MIYPKDCYDNVYGHKSDFDVNDTDGDEEKDV